MSGYFPVVPITSIACMKHQKEGVKLFIFTHIFELLNK